VTRRAITSGSRGATLLRVGPWAGLVFASFAYRWPALINAGTVDSDAAIVGLQGVHILRGEWAWFLFGSGYQTSVDSVVAAAFFAFLGPNPLALMLSTLTGHVIATLLAYATLARHLPKWCAALATLPLVFTPSPLHTYILGPPRQASITLVFLAVWLLDGSRAAGAPPEPSRARRGTPWAFMGGLVSSLACFADPYALLFLPPLLLLGLLVARDSGSAPGKPVWRCGLRAEGWRRFGVTLLGAFAGIVPLALLLASAKSVHGEATFTTSVLSHNLRLLKDECLPWVLSTTGYVPIAEAVYVPWRSGAFRIVQVGGALSLLTMGLGAFTWGLPEALSPVRDLGRFGRLVVLLTLAAFLLSPMVMDVFSSRYLSALILTCPFTLAPAAASLGARRFGALLAPYLASAMTCGWLGFGPRVSGFEPVRLPGGGALGEEHLGRMLLERGIEHAVADYWVSYRLTFLYKEAIEVVPIHAAEDRYAPYRQAFERATPVAYIFDATRSREKPTAIQEELATTGAYEAAEEILHVGGLTAVIARRR
jgi:hypothetical protein